MHASLHNLHCARTGFKLPPHWISLVGQRRGCALGSVVHVKLTATDVSHRSVPSHGGHRYKRAVSEKWGHKTQGAKQELNDSEEEEQHESADADTQPLLGPTKDTGGTGLGTLQYCWCPHVAS